ncbi:MAG TPA: diguanylate cyclase, partial [Spirochaetia bacterium]|nr:diguanylate cyclase [Spirochaetia bacterium]
AGPALERAIEFESVVRQEDINPVTGLPSFQELYSMLALELARLTEQGGTLAVLIVELANYNDLAQRYGKPPTLGLLRDVARVIQEAAGSQARLFHYKGEAQLAVICPKLDADGTSLLSLTLLERANSTEWTAGGERAHLELMLGFANRSRAAQTADSLLAAAENLLEMQRV